MNQDERQKRDYVQIDQAYKLVEDCTIVDVEGTANEEDDVFVNLYLQGGDPGGVGWKKAEMEMGGIWYVRFTGLQESGTYQAEAKQGEETDLLEVMDCQETMGMGIGEPEELITKDGEKRLRLRGTGPAGEMFGVELLELSPPTAKLSPGGKRCWKVRCRKSERVRCQYDGPHEGVKVWRWDEVPVQRDCKWVQIRLVGGRRGNVRRYLMWKTCQVPPPDSRS